MSFQCPDIVRPPSEADCYFLPLTGGCSNNTCTFCRWYGQKLTLRDTDAVKAEIDALAAFRHGGLVLPGLRGDAAMVEWGWDGRRVFLQDGDALVYPYSRLVAVLEHLNRKLPEIQRVAKPKKNPVKIEVLQKIEDHISILYGRTFSGEKQEGIYEVIVTEGAMKELDLRLNEVYLVTNMKNIVAFRAKVVGVFTIDDEHDAFWYTRIDEYIKSFFLNPVLYRLESEALFSLPSFEAEWFYALDYYGIHVIPPETTLFVCRGECGGGDFVSVEEVIVHLFLENNEKAVEYGKWLILLRQGEVNLDGLRRKAREYEVSKKVEGLLYDVKPVVKR